MFPILVQRANLIEILPLNHLESLIKELDKYFPSISLEECDWIRNPFVESLNVDFSLTEEEKLAGISNDRTFRMKHTVGSKTYRGGGGTNGPTTAILNLRDYE